MEHEPRHILIVTHYYPPHIGGIEMIARSQAKELLARGRVVTVVTSLVGSKNKSEMVDGVRVIRVPVWNYFEKLGIPFPIFSPGLFIALSKAVRKADIVHIHDAFYLSSFFGALIARWNRKPVVLTQHVALIAHPSKLVIAIQKLVYATTGTLIFRFSDSIIFFNDRVKTFLIQRGVSKIKCIQLQNGVDTDLFRPVSIEERKTRKRQFGLDPEKKVLLFVGRFVPKKGYDKVLAARSSKYQIVCAGGEAPKESLDNVFFLGKFDQRTLAQVYQTADIFILPSESEGFPLSIQEAMASGLPIITAKDPGYEQYGLDENLFYCIDRPTIATLQVAIDSLVSDDPRLSSMATYSEYYAKTQFGWPLIISKLEDIYESALLLKSPAVRRKRIAIVSDAVYPFNKGGKEKRIHDISIRLASRGYDVTIYCMQWWKGEKIIHQDGVTLQAISPYYPLYSGDRRSFREAILFSLHCFKMLNKKFDLVEVDHMPHLVLFTMRIVCFLKRKQMIVTWHEVWGREYWMRYVGTIGLFAHWIERMSMVLPDTIISVSEHTTKALRQVLGNKKEIITIPNGLDILEVTKSPPSSSGADVLFAGRLLAHKHVDMLLRAARILVHKNPTLSVLIIGEGPEKTRLEGLTRELGIEKNVSFRDFFEDQNDLYRVMQASGVFVLPSTREGFGIVVLEANACGLPVVTIDDAGNAAKDLIVEGENGTVTSLDAERIADAVETMILTKKERSIYRADVEKYNWDNLISKLLQVYAVRNV